MSIAYGVLTEVLQGVITTTRFFDYFDMLANALGCMIVWLLIRNRKQVAS
jgi:glycopeptide antibiotics resistance protein